MLEWASNNLWVGNRRRVGISYWKMPYGPLASSALGQYVPPLVERCSHDGWAVRIPLTRVCVSTYRRPAT